MRANKSASFLESEAHELALINCNLMILNEIGINRKLFKLVLVLIALYFDPRITHTKFGRTILKDFKRERAASVQSAYGS